MPNVRDGRRGALLRLDMAHQVTLAGASVDKVEAGALGALSNYGLDEPAAPRALAVHSNAETLRAVTRAASSQTSRGAARRRVAG